MASSTETQSPALVTIPSVQIPNYTKTVVQPLVIFNILDAFMRRSAESTKVMGSLLGRIENDTIYVENSFSVPYEEDPVCSRFFSSQAQE